MSARPETIWFARNVIVRNAWIAASAAPASPDARIGEDEHRCARSFDALSDPETDHRPEQHHPLDTEVEDARALGQKLAERRKEERRPVQDRVGEDDDEQGVVHRAGSTAGPDPPCALERRRIRNR